MTQNTLRHIVFISLFALVSEASAVTFPTYSGKKIHSYSCESATIDYPPYITTASVTSNNTSTAFPYPFSSLPKVQSVANGSCFVSNAPLITNSTSFTLHGSVPPPSDPNPGDQLPIGDSLTLALFALFYSLIRFRTFDISDVSKPREAAKR